MSRSSWKYLRRMQMIREGFTLTTVRDLETNVLGPDSARARFVQTYHSPEATERVAKTLKLVRDSGRWLILEERSATAPAEG